VFAGGNDLPGRLVQIDGCEAEETSRVFELQLPELRRVHAAAIVGQPARANHRVDACRVDLFPPEPQPFGTVLGLHRWRHGGGARVHDRPDSFRQVAEPALERESLQGRAEQLALETQQRRERRQGRAVAEVEDTVAAAHGQYRGTSA